MTKGFTKEDKILVLSLPVVAVFQDQYNYLYESRKIR